MGSPVKHSQWTTSLTKGDSITTTFSAVGTDDNINPRQKATSTEKNLYSDANLIIYSSKNQPKVEVKFSDMFPTSLSGL